MRGITSLGPGPHRQLRRAPVPADHPRSSSKRCSRAQGRSEYTDRKSASRSAAAEATIPSAQRGFLPLAAATPDAAAMRCSPAAGANPKAKTKSGFDRFDGRRRRGPRASFTDVEKRLSLVDASASRSSSASRGRERHERVRFDRAATAPPPTARMTRRAAASSPRAPRWDVRDKYQRARRLSLAAGERRSPWILNGDEARRDHACRAHATCS